MAAGSVREEMDDGPGRARFSRPTVDSRGPRLPRASMNDQKRPFLTSVGVRVGVMCAVGVTAACAPYFLAETTLRAISAICVLAIFAMSVDLLVGYSGLPTLGHGVPFALGAYGSAVVATQWTAALWATALTGVLLAALCGAVMYLLALRTRKFEFVMITLGFSGLTVAAVERFAFITRGSDGMAGIPAPSLGGAGVFSLSSAAAIFWLSIGCALVTYFVLRRIVNSSFGKFATAVRENEVRAVAIGVRITPLLAVMCTLGSAVAGLAGVLHVYVYRFVSPVEASFLTSARGLFMPLIGGMGTLIGAVIGAALLFIVEDVLSLRFTQWRAVLGILFIVFVLAVRGGIVGLLRGGRDRFNSWLDRERGR